MNSGFPYSCAIGLLSGLAAIIPVQAGTTVQDPANVIGTGDKAWSYLMLEAEDYETEADENSESGFVKANDSGGFTSGLGKPVLGKDTTASKKGALFTVTAFAAHADKVTYKVQFSKPGTYYLYMRFTMFENGGNDARYLNEDSFFMPPDFGKDPQTDWPLSDRGGYTEGCCDAGYLTIPDDEGIPINHGPGGEEGQAFWEGNFHWNKLATSQFLNEESQGEPKYHHKYLITPSTSPFPIARAARPSISGSSAPTRI